MSRAVAVCLCLFVVLAAAAPISEPSFQSVFHAQVANLASAFEPLTAQTQQLQAVATSPSLVSSAAASSGMASSIVSSLPRFGFSSNIADVGGSADKMQSYGIGVGMQFAIGLVLAILTFLVGCCFCCCRCCCNWCGGREPDEGGYSKCQRWGTYVVMALFALGVAAFAVIGYLNNNQVSAAITGDAGVIQSLTDLIGNTIFFLIGTPTSVPQPSAGVTMPATQGLTGILLSIVTSITSSLGTVQAKLGDTGIIFTGVPALFAQISAVGSGISQISIVSNGQSFPCSYCQTVGSQVTTMSNQLSTQTAPKLDSMKSVINSINSSIVQVSGSIATQINSTVSQITSASGTVTPFYDQAKNAKSQAAPFDDLRNLGVLVILALPCTALVALLFGGLCKAGCPFTCYYWVGYCSSFLIFIMFALHLPLATVLSDGCGYVSLHESNLSAVSALASSATLLDACLYNKSLIAVYNLTSQLNFTSAVQFPTFDVAALTAAFQFSALNNFTNDIRALTPLTFSFDVRNTTIALESLKALTDTCNPAVTAFTRETVTDASGNGGCKAETTCTVNTVTIAASDPCTLSRSLVLTERSINATLAAMRVNATALDASSAQLTTDITAAFTNVIGGMKTALAPLLAAGQTFTNAAYCGFIGYSYFQIKTALCTTMGGAFAALACCFFAIGILNFGVIVCSTMLSKRMPNPAEVQVAPLISGIEMLAQPTPMGPK